MGQISFVIGWLILASGCSGGGITLGSRLSGRYDGVSDFEDVKIEIDVASGEAVRVALDKPTSEKINRLSVRRYEGTNCESRSENEGTLISEDPKASSWVDSSSNPAQSYCYKAFIYDTRGQLVTRTVVKPAVVEPLAGLLEFEDFGNKRIVLKHQAPQFEGNDGVELRRYAGDDCSKAAASAGKLLPMGKESASLEDTDLQLGRSYCYKIFWYSRLGGVASSHLPYPLYETGSLSIKDIQNQRINLNITPAKNADFVSFELRRFASLTCETQEASAGTLLSSDKTITTFEDKELALGSPYCYRASWQDRIGNKSQSTVVYTATPPRAGSIAITGMSSRTLTLSHTNSPDTNLARVMLKRHTQLSCHQKNLTEGIDVPITPASTVINDSSLSLATPYCYRAFWLDAFGNSSSDTVTYDGIGPAAGTLSIHNLSSQTIHLAVTQPSDARLSLFIIERHEELSCANAARGSGVALAVSTATTAVTDSSRSLNTAYCYRGLWLDDFGNFSSASVSYDGTGPQGGELRAIGRSHEAIAFNLSFPTTPFYRDFEVRRYLGGSCGDTSQSAGILITSGTTATHFVDTGLNADTEYCYKIFWADKFGNNSSQLPSSQGLPTRTVAPIDINCVSYNPSQQITFIAGTYNQHPLVSQEVSIGPPCSAPSSWVDAGIAEAKPAFLSTNWTSGGNLLFTGRFAPDAQHQVSATPLVYDWSINIDGNKNVEMPILRILDGTTTTYVSPSAQTVSDSATASLAGNATLNGLYDGSQASLSYLTGSAGEDVASTLGPVAFGTDTDIPGLTYVTSGSGAGPYMLSAPSSYSGATHTVQGGYNLYWDYGALEQGDYFIRTKPFLQIDSAYVYGSASSTKVTLSDAGGENILASGQDIGHSDYFGDTRQVYLPSLTIAQVTTGATFADVHGIMYAARNNNLKQYIGNATLQHSATSSPIWSQAPQGQGDRTVVTITSGDSAQMGIVSIPGEADGLSSRWLTIGNENVGSSAMLVLSAWNFVNNDLSSQNLAKQHRFELNKNLTDGVFQSRFGAFGLSEAYQDQAQGSDGVWRHGLAFFAKDDVNDSGVSTGKMYVTALRSKPTSSPTDSGTYGERVARYFDLVTYPGDADTTPKQHIPSVVLASSVPEDAQLVRIASQDETVSETSGTFFYVGWRTGSIDSPGTPMAINLARISSQLGGASPPVATLLSPPMTLTNTAVPGQGYYTLSAGTDDAGISLVAIAFAPYSAAETNRCGLRLYRWNGTSLVRLGTSDLVIADYPGKLCVYPSIFFEKSQKVFHVLSSRVDNALGTSGVTFYKRFALQTTGPSPAMVPTNPTDLPVTQALADHLVCGFTSAFKEATTSQMLSRLSWVRVEYEGSNTCGSGEAKLRFDTYKPQR